VAVSAAATGDRLVRLAEAADAQVEAAQATFEAGFPAAVRAPFAELLDTRPDERLQIFASAAGDVLGVTLVRDLAGLGWTFLRYFVVTGDRRGQGIGSRQWSALCRDLADRGQTRILFDVEDPDDPAADAAERDERERRVRFYQRLNADLVAVEDYAPPHHGAPGTAVIPLRLMAAQIDDTGRSSTPPSDPTTTAAMLTGVMRHRYGVEG
jgi:GNAT superfamily N-acetyltransferase